MNSSFKIGKIAGIEIGVHYTWILALGLFAWLLAASYFPNVAPESSITARWIFGVLASLLLFLSVLIHEIAHSLVATARGMKVQGITLFIFGGVSNIQGEPEKPGIEFVMAIVGPLASLVLAGIFFAISSALFGFGGALAIVSVPLAKGTILQAMINYLWFTNLLLGIFNLLPGFPLDGGRVFRSILWRATGSMSKATNIAGVTGEVFGWAFIALGVYFVFSGNFLNGLWIAFIGWFLSSAASSSRRETSIREHLSGVKVGDIMETTPECVLSNSSVDDVVRQNFIQHGRRALPICREGVLEGIVTLADVKKVPQERWQTTSIKAVMTKPPLHTVQRDDDLNTALKLMAQDDFNQVPVLENGKLVGLLSRANIVNYLQTSQELRIKPKKQPDNKF